ncbi:hypothetical protein OG552_12275 [Streptomyces sp. NBC_01476]|uniref:hypothetical protein n=1 Tax=Streptomyces sp. NBC_01476 TaxID=2903881 RepID=UPI002E32BC34|nr:hypothetical protein [Streptomyces sp. NBC_01476]
MGMLTVDLRRVLAAALLTASVTMFAAGCGEKGEAGGGPRKDRVDGGTVPSVRVEPSGSDGKTAPFRVVYFSSSEPAAPEAHEVLHDAGELGRFAAKVAPQDRQAAEITAGGKDTDFSRDVLVGWTASTGCSAATAAVLHIADDRLSVRVSQPEPPRECLRAFVATVLFAVPKESMPANPVFG